MPTQRTGGELRARVDSSSEPPGRYVFRIVATDIAGNAAVSTARADGSAMVLGFPLRHETRLRAAIGGRERARIGYGSRPRLEAVLRDAGGDPAAGQEIEVVERFVPGSSLAPIGRTLTTDDHGRIDVRLARGPGRTVAVRYAGSRRWLGSEAKPVRVAVRGSARIEPLPARVRAGKRVVFRGRIGVFGAALPKGKLVELQVRGGGGSAATGPSAMPSAPTSAGAGGCATASTGSTRSRRTSASGSACRAAPLALPRPRRARGREASSSGRAAERCGQGS